MRNDSNFGFRLSAFGLINPQFANHNPHSKGFTLVEIVITIVLIGILSGIAAIIILQGVRAYTDEKSRSDVHYQARLAVERVAREARLARSCADITPPGSNPFNIFTFTKIDGATVTFDASTGNLTLDGNTLATNINANPFTLLDRNGNGPPAVPGCGAPPNDIWFVEINITDTQGSETLQMRTRVHPRNF